MKNTHTLSPRAARLRQRLDDAHALGYFEGKTRDDRARHRWMDERQRLGLPPIVREVAQQ